MTTAPIATLREQEVLQTLAESGRHLSNVADLYGVETGRINEAVRNNPEKFLSAYILVLTKEEKGELVENFDRFRKMKHSSVNPKAFTEKGLYMLATILKSERATQTTIAIVEAFAKIRQLSGSIRELSDAQDKVKQTRR